MHDLALMAAQEWARANSNTSHDPVKFGHNVALIARSCLEILDGKDAINKISTGVSSVYQAMQSAEVSASAPQIAPIADAIMKAAGYSDQLAEMLKINEDVRQAFANRPSASTSRSGTASVPPGTSGFGLGALSPKPHPSRLEIALEVPPGCDVSLSVTLKAPSAPGCPHCSVGKQK